MSVTCRARCPACGHPAYDGPSPDPEDQNLASLQAIASAISAGHDLGGVFKLGATLAKARVTIGVDHSIDTAEARRAAAKVQAAQERVAAEFNRLADFRRPCRVCELREQLNYLITAAGAAVRTRHIDHRSKATVAACDELAFYAGDDKADASATRAVLKLARDVFLAALCPCENRVDVEHLAAGSPDLAW